MAYELKAGEKLPHAIRRITQKQVECILSELSHQRPGHTEKAIHEARKDLKKARAVLRLVRNELGGRVYRRDACRLRNVAHALATQRDVEAQLKTVEKFLGRHRGRNIRAAWLKLSRFLRERRRKLLNQKNGDGKKLTADLCATRRHIKHWPVDEIKWHDLACGIRRTYERGLQAFRVAARARTPANLHEWRKRVKDLWYQSRILKPVQQEAITAFADRLKRLSDYLGDEHDLFMIEESAKNAGLDCGELEAVSRLVCTHRAKLQEQAFELGRRLYSEKSSEFAARIERYGKAACRQWADGGSKNAKNHQNQ
ncbi:MAG: hypothetical protein JWQ04_1359 [Pedosphaera sp.]|nr:hypothetical protein [Pedosphaera sp.]